MNKKPTQTMINAANAVFVAMAYTETIRPIVEGYEKAFLAKFKPAVAEKWKSRRGDELITDPKHAYLMCDADLELYLDWCNEHREKAGLKVETPEHCPLLVAEHIQDLAEDALVQAMTPITGLTPQVLLASGLDNYKELVDLSLKWLAPHCKPKAA